MQNTAEPVSVMRNDWEFFCDEAYYDMWAVRPTSENQWGKCFHLNTKEEAELLAKHLTEHNVPSPWQNS